MKKIITSPFFYLAITAAVLIAIYRNEIKAWWNKPAENKPAPPAEGTSCKLNGQAGTIVNGACVPATAAERVVLVPLSSSRIRGRRSRCFTKPAGAACDPRIFDRYLGWGYLYSYTNTTCCYIF